MGMAEVFAPIEAAKRAAIFADTWGHLFPKGPATGYIVVAHSIYRDVVILEEELNINGSPWWYETVHDFARERAKKMKRGSVKRFDITARPVRVRGGHEIRIQCHRSYYVQLKFKP